VTDKKVVNTALSGNLVFNRLLYKYENLVGL